MGGVNLTNVATFDLGGIFVVYFLLTMVIFIVGVSNARDTDPRGSRPMAAYYYSAAFLFLWTTYLAVAIAFDSLVQLIGRPSQAFYTNLAIRDCVLGAIVMVFAGGAYSLHVRRGNVLADTEADASGPTKRVMRSYVAFTSFASVLIFVAAFIAAAHFACQLISPSIFGGSTDHTVVVREILDACVLIVLSGAIFSFHQRFAPSSLRLLGLVGKPRRRRYPSYATSGPSEPPPPPTPTP
jgi:hypothetical protein